MKHDARHANQLRELLAQVHDVAAGFAASDLAGCAECRRELELHQGLLDELEQLGRAERDGLEAARRLPSAPGRAERALRAHVEEGMQGVRPRLVAPGGPATPAAPLRPPSALLAAAASLVAVAALAFLATRDRDEAGPPDGTLLGARATLVHPRDLVADFTPFRWEVPLPEGGHFLVHVEGDDFELRSERLYASEWAPEETPAWPARIRWTLEVYRASGPGDLVASYVAWAER